MKIKNIFIPITAILSLAAVSCSPAVPKISDAEGMGLSGHVKSITELVRLNSATIESENRDVYDRKRVIDFSSDGRITNVRETYNGLTSSLRYIYGKDSLLTRVELYNDEEGLIQVNDIVHNSNGSVSSVNISDSGNKPVMVKKYKYDGKGNIVEETNETPSGDVMNIIYSKYDGNGRRTESVSHPKDGNPSQRFTFEYNDKGELIKSSTENRMFNDISSSEYSYENYDRMDNWRLRTSTLGGVVIEKNERIIEYYK